MNHLHFDSNRTAVVIRFSENKLFVYYLKLIFHLYKIGLNFLNEYLFKSTSLSFPLILVSSPKLFGLKLFYQSYQGLVFALFNKVCKYCLIGKRYHCVKAVLIWSFSGPNAEKNQKNYRKLTFSAN